ncbi:MAG: phenylacetate--CoA ligase family protein [Pirellulales bacterium]
MPDPRPSPHRAVLLRGDALRAHQLERLNSLLVRVSNENRFYGEKLADCHLPLERLERIEQLPFTTKEELLGNRHEASHAANLTYPEEAYVHYHRTSGTRGRPMVVMDTAEDWQWWTDCWQYVLDAAEIDATDRALLAFSFGPFIGFWSACDALVARSTQVIPGGGMGTLSRLELLETSRATALFCTPTYALHMAEVAGDHNMNLVGLPVRRIVVAGEPGGSVPTTRRRIEEAWGAKVIDHSGATEVGPWGCGDPDGHGLHVIETQFIAEFLSVETGKPAMQGELSHLILTPLGRYGSPVIRYRTGDLVRPSWERSTRMPFVLLEGGVLGRTDDMIIVRGVNVFPSSVEQILHGFPEVVEYRLIAQRAGALDRLVVEVEDRMEAPGRIAEELRLRLGLKVDVRGVPLGTLPRFEAKAKRFVDQRHHPA